MSNQLKLIALSLCLIINITACKKDFLERSPLEGPSAVSFYSNQDELMLGLFGCYRSMVFLYTIQRVAWPVILEETSDNSWDRSNGPVQDIGKGSHDANNVVTVQAWTEFYKGVGR